MSTLESHRSCISSSQRDTKTYSGTYEQASTKLRKWLHNWGEYVMVPVSIVLFLVVWSTVVRIGNYPAFILPGPSRVYDKFLVTLADGTLWRHTQVTLLEILAGLFLGLS